uniref:GTPase IMAP family member 2-like n=1 Tax=Sinocyclocheilus grahami TaxID=75366 RepID=A0A672K3R8_SINGR
MMEAGEDSDRHYNCPALPEIKAIIIGSKAEYKRSAADTIFGHIDCKVRKEIVKSEMKQRTVQNRSVTLVMTPGWWRSVTLGESAKYLKMEIVHSLRLCPSPHAFLLVINLHKHQFTVMHLKSVVEHMEIFGEQIWNHTIVLLMYDNTDQRHADSKQLIERAGKELDIVIKKCGNRVHVFNYTDSKGINVEKLFREIENLVAQHEGQSFKIDSKLFEDMEEKRRNVKKQAEERSIQIKTKMQNLKERLTGMEHLWFKKIFNNTVELIEIIELSWMTPAKLFMNFHVLFGRVFSRVKDCPNGWQYCWEDLSGEYNLKN